MTLFIGIAWVIGLVAILGGLFSLLVDWLTVRRIRQLWQAFCGGEFGMRELNELIDIVDTTAAGVLENRLSLQIRAWAEGCWRVARGLDEPIPLSVPKVSPGTAVGAYSHSRVELEWENYERLLRESKQQAEQTGAIFDPTSVSSHYLVPASLSTQ